MQATQDHLIQEVLNQLAVRCPGFSGAVVATRDGLVLAEAGQYLGDAPAGCASSIMLHVNDCLSLIEKGGQMNCAQEQLIVGTQGLWYLVCLATQHLLMLGCDQNSQAGAVRMLGLAAAEQLNKHLMEFDSLA